MTLRQINITFGGDPVEVTAELVTEHFAIAPSIGREENGNLIMNRDLSLTHIPTGGAFPMPWWSESTDAIRALARELEALPIAWETFTPEDARKPDVLPQVRAAYQSANEAWTATDPAFTIHV